jgi:predicted AAA+ superfamily ATPase
MDDKRTALTVQASEIARRILRILPGYEPIDWTVQRAAVWRGGALWAGLEAHEDLDPIAFDDLLEIDDQKARIELNTQQFLTGSPCNNVLLWGARGTGKSSLVHALLNRHHAAGLRLVEVGKSRLASLPDIAAQLRGHPYRFVLFCDDLSFEADDPSYKVLKSALEGSVFRSSTNVVIYATSNRRHLLPEYASDNVPTRIVDGELHESEAVEEKISLSDRFGLWLSFYPFRQDAYLTVARHWVSALARDHGVDAGWDAQAEREALRWALGRGVRSGRTAQHFARHWVGSRLVARSVDLAGTPP